MLVKTSEQLKAFQEGGEVLAKIIQKMVQAAKPSTTTLELDKLARELIVSFGVQPSFLGYQKFPAVSCLSVNNEAVHGVPSDRVLLEGDLLKIDMGVVHGKFHTDSAVTIIVGDGKKEEYAEKRQLIAATRDAMYAGIAQARIGNKIRDIGKAVQEVADKHGFVVVRDLGGHGIGKKLHEEPFIPNFYDSDYDQDIVEGMALAIEPILSNGSWQTEDGHDGFVYITKDGSLAAHFEHTIIVTKGAPLVVTELNK